MLVYLDGFVRTLNNIFKNVKISCLLFCLFLRENDFIADRMGILEHSVREMSLQVKSLHLIIVLQ